MFNLRTKKNSINCIILDVFNNIRDISSIMMNIKFILFKKSFQMKTFYYSIYYSNYYHHLCCLYNVLANISFGMFWSSQIKHFQYAIYII